MSGSVESTASIKLNEVPKNKTSKDVDRQSLTVTDNRTGKTYHLPIRNNAIEASSFKQMKLDQPEGRLELEETYGLRLKDPGFLNTAVIESSISHVDGERGMLSYRGYPIEELASKSNFLEVAYLLIYSNLPTREQFDLFESEVMHHVGLHTDMENVLASFRYDSHPMAVLTSAFSALGTLSPEANPSLSGQNLYTRGAKNDEESLKIMDKQIYRLLGKAISLAAASYRVRQGRPLNKPKPGLGYTEQFLYLMDHLNEDEYKPHPVFAKALDKLFILHAEHSTNCSTTSVLQVGSSLTDPYTSISAGCAALYGPSHGGANAAVIRMLQKIGSPENVPAFLEKVKNREEVLSGFGHRVYRVSDPRSLVVREIAEEVFDVTGKDPLLETALALKDAALADEYFIKRRLAPNVDYFTGLIYRAMSVPVDMMTVLFAVPRVAGWLAHWRQMMLSPQGFKIWRPNQIYTGPDLRHYASIRDRKDESEQDPKKAPRTVAHVYSKRALLASYRGKRAAFSKL